MKFTVSVKFEKLLEPASRGPQAKKPYVQFSAQVRADGDVMFHIKGLRVGDGKVLSVGAKGSGGYHNIVDVTGDVATRAFQQAFKKWAVEFPAVKFPVVTERVDDADFVFGDDEDGNNGNVSKVSPIKPQLVEKTPNKLGTSSGPRAFTSTPKEYVLDNGEVSKVYELSLDYKYYVSVHSKNGTVLSGFFCCDGDNPIKTLDTEDLTEFQARICPKCGKDWSRAELRYGVNWRGAFVDRT